MGTAVNDLFPDVPDGPAVRAGRGGGTGIGRPGSRLTLSPGPDTILGPTTGLELGPELYMDGDLAFVAPVRSETPGADRLLTPLLHGAYS